MANYQIKYGLGGGFGGIRFQDWEDIEAGSYDDAVDQAWQAACDVYDSYAGLHGLRDIDQIMEEDEVDADDAECVYQEERESWLDYAARLKPEGDEDDEE